MNRTYIFLRIWRGWQAPFPASAFDDVADDACGTAIYAAVSAALEARSIPYTFGNDEAALKLGWKLPKYTSRLSTARWYALIGLDDAVAAADIMDSLRRYAEYDWGILSFRSFMESEFTIGRLAEYHRQIQELDDCNHQRAHSSRAVCYDNGSIEWCLLCNLRREGVGLAKARASIVEARAKAAPPVVVEAQPAEIPARERKKPVGRPRAGNAKEDKKIYEAWKTNQYPTHADLGRAFGKDEPEARRICDRVRKSLERAPKPKRPTPRQDPGRRI